MTLLSASLAMIWLAVFWLLSRDRIMRPTLIVTGIIAHFIAVTIAAAPQLSIMSAYPDDSLWTLDLAGRAGVLAISGLGIAAMFILFALKTRVVLRLKHQVSGTAWALFDVALGLLFFGVIHTVSPQVFYTFYRFIFAGLPDQWVIDGWFDAGQLQTIAALAADGNLAGHLAGVTLWAIIPFTLWLHLHHWWRG